MFRRSLRLQEGGYYTAEGSPSLCYKEKLFKVFWRRKCYNRGDQRHSRDQYESASQQSDDHQDVSHNQDNIRDNRDTTAATNGTQSTRPWVPQNWTNWTVTTHDATSRTQAALPSTSGTQVTQIRTAGPQAPQTSTIGTLGTQTWTRHSQTTRTATQTSWTHTWSTQTFRPKRKRVRTTCSSSLNIIGGFLLLLLLLCGFTYSYMQMRELQQEVQSLRRHIVFPLADALPNFALKSQGASVQASLSSDVYRPHSIWMIDRLFYWWHATKQQMNVIRGDSSLHPGDCWPLSGNQGHLFITLSHPASITHVTLGHITKSQSPSGFITSAPREFSIYGITTINDEGTYLGTSVYDQDGSAFQTFELTNPDKAVFRHVKLQVNSNWGNIDYTCLYSFRVHGKLLTY